MTHDVINFLSKYKITRYRIFKTTILIEINTDPHPTSIVIKKYLLNEVIVKLHKLNNNKNLEILSYIFISTFK